MPEQFTAEERKVLSQFVTSLDSDVFALRNLPEVVMGALFSRYSRSPKSLRRTLLDEFIKNKDSGFEEIVGARREGTENQMVATQKAEEFYDRVLVGYGDDSVAELGGAHLAVENVSNIATKFIEDARLGISPLEKSTRYIYFNEKQDGKYRYLREKTLVESRHAQPYEETCDLLFDTYAGLMLPMSEWLEKKFPRDEKTTSERAYASTIRAKTCDVLRGLLPASTLTNVGLFGNGRSFEYLLLKMYASELAEVRSAAAAMHAELRKVIPSFVKRADDEFGRPHQEHIKRTRASLKEYSKALQGKDAQAGQENDEVTLTDYDNDAEQKIVSALLYSNSQLPLAQIKAKVRQMPQEQRRGIIESCWKSRGNRRHKLPRGFENAQYTFDVCANFGCYRDLHRHRILTQERQLLSTRHGYDLPPELKTAGLHVKFEEAMKAASEAYEKIAAEFPNEAQYVVPLAYRLRWYITLNAREAAHLIELRSMPQGHEDYRRVVLKMHAEIRRVHPWMADAMKFVKTEGIALERLEAEKFQDKMAAGVERKWGRK
ncbi:MAG: FAD-dependent thymidylate synthase [Candidatus Micrarchaeota archaeon]